MSLVLSGDLPLRTELIFPAGPAANLTDPIRLANGNPIKKLHKKAISYEIYQACAQYILYRY